MLLHPAAVHGGILAAAFLEQLSGDRRLQYAFLTAAIRHKQVLTLVRMPTEEMSHVITAVGNELRIVCSICASVVSLCDVCRAGLCGCPDDGDCKIADALRSPYRSYSSATLHPAPVAAVAALGGWMPVPCQRSTWAAPPEPCFSTTLPGCWDCPRD
ncbi:hypothetical protein Vretifemale_1647 [Volvox reticuliferus]|uniref:Uncharacterized protein n=1 Tax=Volvox reticuliferus TaxID=1737510 RepID=A0A8J4C0V6_9CHLO|nr:hypothetical protein Vretifemale_1647 [Volvox reticuliferus]